MGTGFPRILSPIDHTWQIRVEQEMTRHYGGAFATVYMDCYKCYERVSYAVAVSQATATGCPGQVVNLVFAIHQSSRHISIHGAMAKPVRGFSGLIAGCGFAVHMLKA